MTNKKFILALLSTVLLTGILVVAIIRDRIVNNTQWTINVTGRGKVAYQPDTATVTVGVQIDKAFRAETALKELTSKINAILSALEKLKIAPKNIQTKNYTILPQYETIGYTTNITGYSANQQISIKVIEINSEANKKLISQIIENSTKAGANQILGVNFEMSNIEDVKQEARLKAITDARSKADVLTRTADVKIKKIVGWWENQVYVPSQANSDYYGGLGMGGIGGGGENASQINSGEQEVIIEINVNYLLK